MLAAVPIAITSDTAHIAAFLDGNREDAYRFLKNVWLPDTTMTLQRIVNIAEPASAIDVHGLCAHLRASAGTVGVIAIMHAADLIELAIDEREDDFARTIAGRAIDACAGYECALEARLRENQSC